MRSYLEGLLLLLLLLWLCCAWDEEVGEEVADSVDVGVNRELLRLYGFAC